MANTIIWYLIHMIYRDADDHVKWLLVHGYYEKALAAVEEGNAKPELLEEVLKFSYLLILGL